MVILPAVSEGNPISANGDLVAFRNEGCFVCGRSNARGLHLEFEHDRENRRATSRVIFSEEHQGWDDIIHGGILAAVLDDVMAHSIMAAGFLAITTRISVIFREPVRVGEVLVLEGQVTKIGKRIATAIGTGYGIEGDGETRGRIKCEAEGTFFLDRGGESQER